MPACPGAQAGKAARKDLLGAFSGEALDAAGARRDAPPFAVVASTTMDLSVGRWGVLETLERPYGARPLCTHPRGRAAAHAQ